MDEDDLIGLLPVPYAVAMRLRRAGATDATIAVAAAVDETAVAPLIHLAQAKLRTLRGADRELDRPSVAPADRIRPTTSSPTPVEAHP